MRHISIHDLAKKCCVSSTTVVRFAQKLGFDGFSDLKSLIKREYSAKEITSQSILLLSGESHHVTEFSLQLQLKVIPLISITKLHDNTLAGRPRVPD